ncbi:MAG: OmpH family outer membrane protein [Bacteroides sp.]|nr:OmpH family outer membrane protein [Bacteroides sp.]
MLKKLLLVAAVLFPMLASAQTLKIGIVDTQELIAKMPDTAAAQKQLEEVSKKYQDEYTKLGEEMKRMVDEYQNMKEDELPAIRERKTRELSDYQQKIQQFEQTADQDLQKMQYDLMSPVLQKIRTAIEAVGKEGGYSLVQNKDAQIILYYDSPVVDITNDVKAKLGIN